MAQGDIIFFDQFLQDLMDADVGHDFGSGNTTVVKVSLIKSTGTTPDATTADPRYGSGGTTDFSSGTEEVTAGGNYTAGGISVGTVSITNNSGTIELDFTVDPSWDTDGSNPTDARYGFIYNDTLTGKQGMGFVDLGTVFDMTTGTLSIVWPNPVATLNQA